MNKYEFQPRHPKYRLVQETKLLNTNYLEQDLSEYDHEVLQLHPVYIYTYYPEGTVDLDNTTLIQLHVKKIFYVADLLNLTKDQMKMIFKGGPLSIMSFKISYKYMIEKSGKEFSKEWFFNGISGNE